MKDITLIPSDRYGYDFIPPQFLSDGMDEYTFRNLQMDASNRHWRKLRASEIEILVKNDNFCADWDDLLVSDPFDPNLIRNSNFYGLVRLGRLRDVLLGHHDFKVSAGIRNSTVISCDIGDDCSIQDCSYLSHYILGDMVILSRIDEMQSTNHAKFGNGILKDGEAEDIRVWIDVMNEAGGRSVLPFEDMICADAYLWAAYRDDAKLVARLAEITQAKYGSQRGAYGTIGSWSVIKSCQILKDVVVGECCYIKGANKLKNLTIHSSEAEPTQIGEGVELVNGIIGYGCHIFYGCKAVRFVMGRNCGLKYGARLIHSILGDNSTVSCCEMLNNLVFPAHEQHHNNSFLIASLVQGLSNMAAGATVGSNHNSRAADGEIHAGRGFWPGLCVTLKHSSRFASYCLIAKGDYPCELNIPFPFALVNNAAHDNRLEIMPAYFWMYNMYALERNAWKTRARDKRVVKVQHIYSEYLAPDTVEEIIQAMGLIEEWTGEAAVHAGLETGAVPSSQEELRAFGLRLLTDQEDHLEGLDVIGRGLERNSRPSCVLKPRRSWRAYRHMLHYYAANTLLSYFESQGDISFSRFAQELGTPEEGAPSGRVRDWVNLGGQIVPAFRVDELRQHIGSGEINSWNQIHGEYDAMAAAYPRDCARHAWALLAQLLDRKPDATAFSAELDEALKTRRWISDQVRLTRAKDYEDPFRTAVYRNKAELEAVLGRPEDNSFIRQAAADTETFQHRVEAAKGRL